ncbi:MAG: hypothetical protein ABUL60_18825 [Myxococcales bacterium]
MASNAASLDEAGPRLEPHELPELFAARGFALNGTLEEMLGEHFSHRTPRRGCGFTQASRHLAVLVNQPRSQSHETLSTLFPEWARTHPEGEPALLLQRALRALPAQLEREESRLLATLIADLALPAAAAPETEELPPHFEPLKVGTCPLAEKYFLEVSDGFVRRKGRVNVLVSEAGRPLLLEKLNLGDDHSCVNVAELLLNGVRLPPGCLFAAHYEDPVPLRPNRVLPGSVIPVRRCRGFRFLRLTTLAVSPANRARAFTTHFQSQVDAGLFAPGDATIQQLQRVAEEQL